MVKNALQKTLQYIQLCMDNTNAVDLSIFRLSVILVCNNVTVNAHHTYRRCALSTYFYKC